MTVTGKPRAVTLATVSGGFPFDVHAQINPWVESAGGDEGHDGHQRFQAHRAVAYGPGIRFARDHLGGRAAGDQGVKARRLRRRQW